LVSRDPFVETRKIAEPDFGRLAQTVTHCPQCSEFFHVLLEDGWDDGKWHCRKPWRRHCLKSDAW
jgi:hypothetical protein